MMYIFKEVRYFKGSRDAARAGMESSAAQHAWLMETFDISEKEAAEACCRAEVGLPAFVGSRRMHVTTTPVAIGDKRGAEIVVRVE